MLVKPGAPLSILELSNQSLDFANILTKINTISATKKNKKYNFSQIIYYNYAKKDHHANTYPKLKN